MSKEYTERAPCRRADGLTKFGYSTAAKAKKAARRTNSDPNRGGGKVFSYHCPDCGYYHLGHRPPGAHRNRQVV